MSSAWAHTLTRSRASRGISGLTKMLTFLYLGGLSAYKNATTSQVCITENLEMVGILFSVVTVAMCIIRGIPIFIEGWKAIKGEFDGETHIP